MKYHDPKLFRIVFAPQDDCAILWFHFVDSGRHEQMGVLFDKKRLKQLLRALDAVNFSNPAVQSILLGRIKGYLDDPDCALEATAVHEIMAGDDWEQCAGFSVECQEELNFFISVDDAKKLAAGLRQQTPAPASV